jgi:hypothetical protein
MIHSVVLINYLLTKHYNEVPHSIAAVADDDGCGQCPANLTGISVTDVRLMVVGLFILLLRLLKAVRYLGYFSNSNI